MSTSGNSARASSEKIAAADLFADIEHRSLVAFAFADDDAAAHRHGVHHLAHRFDRDVVGVFAVALAHRLGRFDRRRLGHTQKIERQFAFSFDVFHLIFLRMLSEF